MQDQTAAYGLRAHVVASATVEGVGWYERSATDLEGSPSDFAARVVR
jgi:hypothetical protein